MPAEFSATDRPGGVGQERRYPAGHSVRRAERAGGCEWQVSLPGIPDPARFATEAEAVAYADKVQAEVDRRQRRRSRTARRLAAALRPSL